MRLTERHLIKPNHKIYKTLDELTFKAKNLYNHGLYLYRQSYFEYKKDPEKPILSWKDIDRDLRRKRHEDIQALPSKVANAVLKNLGEAISSYWNELEGDDYEAELIGNMLDNPEHTKSEIKRLDIGEMFDFEEFIYELTDDYRVVESKEDDILSEVFDELGEQDGMAL